jgi:hypothetical protein
VLLGILQDVIDVLCSLDVILGSPVFSADMRNSLVNRVKVILSSSGVVIDVIVLLIWVGFVAMFLGNFEKNLFLNSLIVIIWVKKHVLVISSSVEKVINVFLFRFDKNRLLLNQILWVLMLEEWTEITVSAFISISERNITIFVFFVINLVLLVSKPKFDFFVLEHLLLVVTNIGLNWANDVSV